MDHTLLTDEGRLPPNFREMIQRLHDADITFAIASGRPLYTLEAMFADLVDELTFIADNGGLVKHQGQLLFESELPVSEYQKMLRFTLEQTSGVPIICALDAAYVPTSAKKYDALFRRFYANLEFVDDLTTVTALADKYTVYCPEEDAQEMLDQVFAPNFGDDYSIVIGDTFWVDIMNKGVDKGSALEILGAKLGVDPAEMMAFGDTGNDIAMLKTVGYSYLVANADESMKQYAKYTTASNNDYGVIKVLEELLAAKGA